MAKTEGQTEEAALQRALDQIRVAAVLVQNGRHVDE